MITQRRSLRAFTLVELLVAMAIAGVLMAVSVPMGMRFYDSMQYREAVRIVMSAFQFARHQAVETGTMQDVVVRPGVNELSYGGKSKQLPESINMVVSAAGDLGVERGGVVRFYPEGGATGGDVELESPSGKGVRISVDWLTGKVTQETYVFN
jgi:general secretion pathway protein H